MGYTKPPILRPELDDRAAAELSAQVARDIRNGIKAAGLDLVDDWGVWIQCYPSTDPDRLARIQEVTMGKSTWPVDAVMDEAAAVKIGLARLAQRHGAKALKPEQLPIHAMGGEPPQG